MGSWAHPPTFLGPGFAALGPSPTCATTSCGPCFVSQLGGAGGAHRPPLRGAVTVRTAKTKLPLWPTGCSSSVGDRKLSVHTYTPLSAQEPFLGGTSASFDHQARELVPAPQGPPQAAHGDIQRYRDAHAASPRESSGPTAGHPQRPFSFDV